MSNMLSGICGWVNKICMTLHSDHKTFPFFQNKCFYGDATIRMESPLWELWYLSGKNCCLLPCWCLLLHVWHHKLVQPQINKQGTQHSFSKHGFIKDLLWLQSLQLYQIQNQSMELHSLASSLCNKRPSR